MLLPHSRLLVVLALQAALAVVPSLDRPAQDRPLDRASVVEAHAVSFETGVLSQQNGAEQGGVILKSAHARVAGQALTEFGPKTVSTSSRLQLVGCADVRRSLAFLSVRLQI